MFVAKTFVGHPRSIFIGAAGAVEVVVKAATERRAHVTVRPIPSSEALANVVSISCSVHAQTILA